MNARFAEGGRVVALGRGAGTVQAALRRWTWPKPEGFEYVVRFDSGELLRIAESLLDKEEG